MVPGEVRPGVLLAAVKAAVIIPAKQRAITKWRAETLDDPPLYGDDRLQVNAGADPRQALYAAKIRRKGCPDAIENIALGVGRNRLVYG